MRNDDIFFNKYLCAAIENLLFINNSDKREDNEREDKKSIHLKFLGEPLFGIKLVQRALSCLVPQELGLKKKLGEVNFCVRKRTKAVHSLKILSSEF